MDPLTSVETEGSITAAEPTAGQDRWSSVPMLATAIMVAVPIPKFRVRDVLALKPGCILSSAWCGDRDVPLLAGDVQFAWTEFEVMDERLSARITRLL